MLRLILTLLLFLNTYTLSVAAGELRGGASAIDITPLKLPVSMTGGFQDRQAKSAHDRLHARCIVLDDGNTKIAMVVCDSCLITRDIYDAAKLEASKKTNIPIHQILTSATHTHTAPTVAPLAQCHPDPEYVKQLTRQITESIVTAEKNLQLIELGWTVAFLPDEVSNRRWFVKESAMVANPFGGTEDLVRTNPPRGIDVLLKPTGPVDPEITFVSLRNQQQTPVGVFANYGLHYVGGIPSSQLSADYFGEFARLLQSHLQADDSFVGIMSNGASGDVNNYQFREPRESKPNFIRVQEVASAVVDKFATVANNITYRSDIEILMTEQELTLGIRQPDTNELKRAKELLKQAADPNRLTINEVYAQESVRLSEAKPTVTLKLQTIILGDLAIVTIPCEVFANIGQKIKQQSPFRHTMVVALANGYNGYLPTPKQHALGGYETWRSGWSYLETEASVKITETLLKMLKDQK